MFRRKFFYSLFSYLVIFLVIWNVFLPLVFRKKLQAFFFSSQVPLWRVVSKMEEVQKAVALQTSSKSWWIEQGKEWMRENAYLKLQLARQQDQIELSNRVLQLHQMEVGENFQCLPARVLYRSYETWSQWLLINRGSKDGVCVGQGVLCTQGIVGRIQKVTEATATVELVTHPNFRLLVMVEGDPIPHLFKGELQKKTCEKPFHGILEDVSEAREKPYPRRIETTSVGHQFPDHIYVGDCVQANQKANRYVGIIQLGDYLKHLDVVGVLIPWTDL